MYQPGEHPVFRSGFTLMDTIAGIAATGALLSLATATLGVTRGGSQTMQDQANLMTIGQAAAAYTSDNDGWLVGAPGASGRDLLNDARADSQHDLALEVDGLATQPFDWASPLLPYIAPEFEIPTRRDERFALTNGTGIPDYMAPDFDPSDVDFTPAPGPLGVFADPAQDKPSAPYFSGLYPDGIEGTAFQPQLASSYIAAREHLWWGSRRRPAWALDSFWGDTGTLTPIDSAHQQIPGFFRVGRSGQAQVPHRPYIDRIGDPSRKIFLANGTKHQFPFQSVIDHDVSSRGWYGGAFADVGAWSKDFSRAWPPGVNNAGDDMTRISFRRAEGGATPHGNVLYHDGAVRLESIDDVRRPEPWLPRGAAVRVNALFPELRDEYRERATYHADSVFGGYFLTP